MDYQIIHNQGELSQIMFSPNWVASDGSHHPALGEVLFKNLPRNHGLIPWKLHKDGKLGRKVDDKYVEDAQELCHDAQTQITDLMDNALHMRFILLALVESDPHIQYFIKRLMAQLTT